MECILADPKLINVFYCSRSSLSIGVFVAFAISWYIFIVVAVSTRLSVTTAEPSF